MPFISSEIVHPLFLPKDSIIPDQSCLPTVPSRHRCRIGRESDPGREGAGSESGGRLCPVGQEETPVLGAADLLFIYNVIKKERDQMCIQMRYNKRLPFPPIPSASSTASIVCVKHTRMNYFTISDRMRIGQFISPRRRNEMPTSFRIILPQDPDIRAHRQNNVLTIYNYNSLVIFMRSAN